MPIQTEQKAHTIDPIVAIAEARLRASSYHAVRRVRCTYDHGVLALEGRLRTFFQKQLAQELVANIEGVKQVVNRVEVISRAT
jgi:osmotically-inducible protein OsmY